ncbi:MAG: hypothetical protein HYU83_07055 [Chloroflexi bacterium]|nr:hypothetical protein [Chloroflexota bacterium]
MRSSVPSLQYVIDSICANFTVDSMYELVKGRLNQGPFTVSEIALDIRCKDRTLDFGSSKALAEAALEALAQRGNITMEGDCIYPGGSL